MTDSTNNREVARWASFRGKFTLVLTHGKWGYDYALFDRQWASARSSGVVPGTDDASAIAEVEAQIARGWHGKNLSRVIVAIDHERGEVFI